MQTLPISTATQTAFAERGYVVLPGALDPATLADLQKAAGQIFEEIIGATLTERATHRRLTWWRLPDGRPYAFKVKPVVDLAVVFAEIARSRSLLDVASALLEGSATLMEDKVTYKATLDVNADWAELPVLGEEVRKHSDAAYFAERGYGRVLTVALCLDDCPTEAGALQVWPGSHRRSVDYVPTADQGPVVTDASAPDATAVMLTAAAGAMLAWDAALVHASGPNRTGNPRRLLVLGYTVGGR